MATLVCLCVLRDFHFLKRVCSHTQGCILYEYTLLKQEGKLIFFCQEKLWANRKRFWGSGFTRITIGFPEVSEWETTREREEIWDEEREKKCVWETEKAILYVCVSTREWIINHRTSEHSVACVSLMMCSCGTEWVLVSSHLLWQEWNELGTNHVQPFGDLRLQSIREREGSRSRKKAKIDFI